MNQPLIFNIQKFSVHDGPGIRTTIFFKGCPMRCLWCHNPESQSYGQEVILDKDGHEEIVGKHYPVEELARLAAKDQIFYEQSGGGVTLSGGEVMVQDMDYILHFLEAMRRLGIPVAIDTCGLAPRENFEKVLPFTERFLYDVKLLDPAEHERYTGTSNAQVLENLKYLGSRRAVIDLRMILVKDVNDTPSHMERMMEWLDREKVAVCKVSLLPYHDFGRDKYQRLGRECTQNFAAPSQEALERLRDVLERGGRRVSIGG